MTLLTVNMKQLNKFRVYSDNVIAYDQIIQSKGKFYTDQPDIYTRWLDEYGIFYTMKGAARNNLPGRALQPRKKNPSKRRPTIAGPASAARGEKLWKAAFDGKTYKGYRIVFYDRQNLYGISAHGTHLSYAPTISAAEKIIDQLDPIDAGMRKNPIKPASPKLGVRRKIKKGDIVNFPYCVEYKNTGSGNWVTKAAYKTAAEAKQQAINFAAKNPSLTVRAVSYK